jgi:hypothetical protein
VNPPVPRRRNSPEIIHRGSPELEIAGDVTSQRGAIVLPRPGYVASEKVSGRYFGFGADGLARRTVARQRIQRIIRACAPRVVSKRLLFGEPAAHRSPGGIGVGEIQSRLPRLLARGLAPPETQAVQVAAAVVTEQAVDVRYPQEDVEDIGRLLVENILDGAAPTSLRRC